LADEKAKTSKLRNELVNNLTSMIVSFTDAQDASWSEAVAQVQAANETGTIEMERFAQVSEEVYAESSKRAGEYREELDMGGQTASARREAGRGALKDVTSGLRSRLEGYGKETVVQAGEHVEVVDGFCGRLGAAAADGKFYTGCADETLTSGSREPSEQSRERTVQALPFDVAGYQGHPRVYVRTDESRCRGNFHLLIHPPYICTSCSFCQCQQC